MQRLEVSSAVRRIHVVRRQMVNTFISVRRNQSMPKNEAVEMTSTNARKLKLPHIAKGTIIFKRGIFLLEFHSSHQYNKMRQAILSPTPSRTGITSLGSQALYSSTAIYFPTQSLLLTAFRKKNQFGKPYFPMDSIS